MLSVTPRGLEAMTVLAPVLMVFAVPFLSISDTSPLALPCRIERHYPVPETSAFTDYAKGVR